MYTTGVDRCHHVFGLCVPCENNSAYAGIVMGQQMHLLIDCGLQSLEKLGRMKFEGFFPNKGFESREVPWPADLKSEMLDVSRADILKRQKRARSSKVMPVQPLPAPVTDLLRRPRGTPVPDQSSGSRRSRVPSNRSGSRIPGTPLSKAVCPI